MQSKLFLTAKLLAVLAFVFSLFLPPAEGIRETALHSDAPIQASSANLNSKAGERMISYPEVISKNSDNSGLRLPLLQSCYLLVLVSWSSRVDETSS